jgi:hypothetical protein
MQNEYKNYMLITAGNCFMLYFYRFCQSTAATAAALLSAVRSLSDLCERPVPINM